MEEKKFEDKTIICRDCGKEFTFTAREQEFYEANGYYAPVRCKECRAARKAAQNQENNK